MEIAAYQVAITRYETQGIPFYRIAPLTASPETPIVFALHGLNARKERFLELCLQLTAANLSACLVDLRGHGERLNDDTPLLRGSRTDPAIIPAIIRTILGTVGDVSRVADSLGLSRYALIGHSLGGYTALLAALEDSRAAAVVAIAGAFDLSGMPPDFGVSPERGDVTRRAAELKRIPALLLHGADDMTVPLYGSQLLHAALLAAGASPTDAVLREFPGVGHELTPEMIAEAVAFVRARA